MKVLITGAGGQLGRDLTDAFSDHEVVALTHAQLDITDEASVADALEHHHPALVCNAAAWTDVDGCERDPARAHASNALGPWWLARACARLDATLVHVSTEHVFDGSAPGGPDGPRGYTEVDAVAPCNGYGRSKAAGEQLVRESLARHHIVRTSWLAGGRGKSFVSTMLGLARSGRPIRVVDDQHGRPTFTRDLAAAIRCLAVSGRHGTLHLANTGVCSRFELAAATFELAGLEVDLAPQATRDTDRRAPRPAWSVLDTTHAQLLGIGPLPDWRDALARLLDELEREAGVPAAPARP